MNRKSSLLIILLIFALPVLLYYVTRTPKENSSSAALAEVTNKPKVLHFSQVMCSECRTLEGIMKPVEKEYKDKIVFVNIDVADRNADTEALIKKYNVRVVPTLVFIDKKGKIVKRTEGSMPKEELEGYLNSIIK